MKTRAQFRPRLMPVVISASLGLLALKVIGLTTQGGYLFQPDPSRAGFGRSITDARKVPHWAVSDETTGAAPAKKPAPPPEAEKKGEPLPQPLPPAQPSAAEREVLEKLSERRKQLEERAKELELREELLKSAEKLTQERIDELKKAESRGEAAEAKPAVELKALVTMYESMKPRDAAKVFEKMSPQRLAPLARQMQPKKLAEILAQMSPDAAEKLTFVLMPQPAARPAVLPPESQPLPELERLPPSATRG
jgi:flagellar motility protein MotE (MotC chaperone)